MPVPTDTLLENALRATLAQDRSTTITLILAEREQWPPLPSETGHSIDQALRELRHRGWIVGSDQGGDGSLFIWSGLAATVDGLRHLGEWPPAGQEFLPGPWDAGLWGQLARPALADLAASPPDHGYLISPYPPAERPRWQAILLLRDAGLIDGRPDTEGMSDTRLTAAGAHALDPPVDDPLARARLKLRQGAKADAVTAAIDEALKPLLHGLAQANGVSLSTARGSPLRLANLNDQLCGTAYGSAQHAYISAWLHDRNEVDHGRGADVPDRRLELMLDGIELFQRENTLVNSVASTRPMSGVAPETVRGQHVFVTPECWADLSQLGA